MGFSDLKFKESDFTGIKIADLSDTPSSDGMSAQTLKAYFDNVPKTVIAMGKINDILDELDGEEGLPTKMDKENPEGTGSFSLNRKSDTTIGTNSFAEGTATTASGSSSHAEGINTEALGDASHTEGSYTYAAGSGSHAEGWNTTAAGNYAHAEGLGTSANVNQHTEGKYNVFDSDNKYEHIVGDGSSEGSRSNMHTLDWSGNAWYKGDVYVEGTSQEDAERLAKVSELHSHANKALLDTYTQTEEDLADAVTKKHEHENKTVLDGITANQLAQIETNKSNISAEETRATNAESTLQTNINNESSARSTAINNEATARATAISNEATARANADNTLQTNIDSEASSRASADETLQTNIDAESSARATAVSLLNAEITKLKDLKLYIDADGDIAQYD